MRSKNNPITILIQMAGISALLFTLTSSPLFPQEFRVSGFVAMEVEFDKISDDGEDETEVEAEINKARLNFDLQMTDRVSILAEFNPVPEELTFHQDVFTLRDGRTITVEKLHREEGEGEIIPFERLEIRWVGVRDRDINVSVGQLRNPFGFWEDFTAHRNNSGTKNNALVLGIALRNVDIGAEVDGRIGRFCRYVIGMRNGATVRTLMPRRKDDNHSKDFVGKFVVDLEGTTVGLNTYFVDSKSDKYAVGTEYLLPITELLTFSGETVFQKNSPDELESLSSYLQANYNLFSFLEGLRAYSFFEYWQLKANGSFQGDIVKFFTGLKYKVIPEGLTLTVEYGKINAETTTEFSENDFMIQAEISF